MSGRRFAILAAAVTAAVTVNLAVAYRDAHGMSARVARARVREDRLELRRARGTLRFFERHPRLLYRAPAGTRRIAWREVGRARAAIRRAAADLRRAQAAIPYEAPWPWSCIFRHENAGQGWTAVSPGGTYHGGLQFDSTFELTYGPEYVRRWGRADRWPPAVQVAVAIRARDSGRGYWPWPTTGRECGVLP